MNHDPREEVMEEPFVRELKECVDLPGPNHSSEWSGMHCPQVLVLARPHDAALLFQQRTNPTELTPAHFDELVALARHHKSQVMLDGPREISEVHIICPHKS